MSNKQGARPSAEREKKIMEDFQESLLTGRVKNILGETLKPEDFMAVDPKWSKEEFVLNVVLPQVSTLQGKVLTIVDACFEKERAKYVKDLVKDAFAGQSAHICEMLS